LAGETTKENSSFSFYVASIEKRSKSLRLTPLIFQQHDGPAVTPDLPICRDAFQVDKKKNKIFWGEKNLNENRLSSHLKENKFNLVSLMSSFTWWAGSLLTRGVPCNSFFFLFTREPRKSKVQSSFPSTAMMHREEKHGQDQKGKKVRRRSSRGIV
jgi:hypothetical protein